MIKGVTQIIKNQTKEEIGGFLSMPLGTLCANVLGNILADKADKEWSEQALEDTAGQDFLMLPYSLTNLEIHEYYQSESKFKRLYSWNNLLNTAKDRAYIVSLQEYKSIETHSIALHANGRSVAYFDSFGVEQIPKEIKTFIGNKNITEYNKRL